MNEEIIKTLMNLKEENTRYSVAFKYLKSVSDHDKSKGYGGNVSRTDLEAAMNIAGLEEKEINVITFDNCEDVAYEAD